MLLRTARPRPHSLRLQPMTRLTLEALEARVVPTFLLSSSPSAPYEPTYGDAVTFTATINATPPLADGTLVTLTGPVAGQPYLGSTPQKGNSLGTGTTRNGVATITTTLLQVGTGTVTASYDTGSAPSDNFVVLSVLPSVLVTSSPNPCTPAPTTPSITFTAVVTGANYIGSAPAGTVTFMDSAVMTGSVNGSTITLPSTAGLFAGQHVTGGIPNGTTILSITSNSQVTVTPDTMISTTSESLTFHSGVRELSGTLTNGMASVTGLSSTADLFNGEYVTGPDIPGDTTITKVDPTSNSTITLSQPVTLSGSGSMWRT